MSSIKSHLVIFFTELPQFTTWIDANAKNFKLKQKDVNKFPFNPNDPENSSLADFYIFEKSGV